MKINFTSTKKKIKDIKPSEVFMFGNDFFMQTNFIDTPIWYSVNLRTGFLTEFRPNTEVTPAIAEMTIKDVKIY